jgi:sulfite exporter TauE/SafE
MLTLPLIIAALSAGLIGGFHCVGMCGGIAGLLSRLPHKMTTPNAQALREFPQKVIAILPDPSSESGTAAHALTSDNTFYYQCKLHGGRLTTYMLIGAFFGAMGAASLRWKADLPITTVFFILGNLALIFLGLRLIGVRMQAIIPDLISAKLNRAYARWMPMARTANTHPFLVGMAWGGLPCGLSYAIAPFALLSGAAWSGAMLMLFFGLAALPHLLIAQTISRQIKQHGFMRILQILFALLLISFGLFGLVYFDMKSMPDFLCVTPNYA